MKGIHLDEGVELCREFFPGVVSYPFKEKAPKRKRADEEHVAGTSGAAKKKSRKDGKPLPKDDKNLRKYCLKNRSDAIKIPLPEVLVRLRRENRRNRDFYFLAD